MRSVLAKHVDQKIPRIGNDGRPRIGDDGHTLAFLCKLRKLFGRRKLVEFVTGQKRLSDLIIIEQLQCVAGVFTEDHIRLPQRFQRPQGIYLRDCRSA